MLRTILTSSFFLWPLHCMYTSHDNEILHRLNTYIPYAYRYVRVLCILLQTLLKWNRDFRQINILRLFVYLTNNIQSGTVNWHFTQRFNYSVYLRDPCVHATSMHTCFFPRTYVYASRNIIQTTVTFDIKYSSHFNTEGKNKFEFIKISIDLRTNC